MDRGVGGYADDVQGFPVNHVLPVGIGFGACPGFKTLPTPGIPTASGNKVDAGMARLRTWWETQADLHG